MSKLSRNKPLLIGILAIVCIVLFFAASILPMFMDEADDKGTGGAGLNTNAQALRTYDDPVIDPSTNSLNGLTTESWFGELLSGEQLNFATDQVGNSEFNSTNNAQRDDNQYDAEDTGIAGGAEEKDSDLSYGGDWADMPREIEEADIIKLDGDTLFILNTYRGLLLVDISSPDEPKLESRVPLFGYPVEMYIVEPMAYVVLTHYYNAFLWAEDGNTAPEYRSGSEIVVIDITDHAIPKVVKYIELEGYISNTRRVGEVIYAVANTDNGLYGILEDTGIGIPRDTTNDVFEATTRAEGTDNDEKPTEPLESGQTTESEVIDEEKDEPVDDENNNESNIGIKEPVDEEDNIPLEGTVVISINLEDLNDIKAVDSEWFEGSSNEIHVTEDAIFVAQPEYNYYRDDVFGWLDEYYTKVTYVDISDYHGDIEIRDTFKIDGYLEDRYQMDYYDDTFRIVTHFWGEWDKLGSSKLWIFDTSNPNDISKLGELLIDDAGSLMATRFAGNRAYTIHLPNSVDPLDVLDLSNPMKPVLTDIFEMPGWITHMEVRGYKILALGVDDSDNKRRVAVSLFDVTDPNNAIMKDRVIIGEGYSWSTANWDPKALSVIDDQNIMLVPFQSNTYDEGKYESFNGFQVVEFDLETGDLTAGGAIEQFGTVERTRANSERIFAISAKVLQVIDASNRDKPKVTATLELANNIVDILPMGEHCIQVISDYDYAQRSSVTKFRTVPATEPDTTTYLAEITLNANLLNTFTNDKMVYLVTSEYSEENKETSGRIRVYDFTDPLLPVLRSNHLMEYYDSSYYYGGWYYDYYSRITDYNFCQVAGDLIVYHPAAEHLYYKEYLVNDESEEYKEPEEDIGDDRDSTDSSSAGNGTTTEKEDSTEYYYNTEANVNEIWYIIDLSDPDTPDDSVNITITNTSRITGLYSNGNMLYYTQYDDESYYQGRQWYYNVKYYVTQVDLSNPSAPVLAGPFNIPGEFLGANNAGTVLYTRSSEYDEEYNWLQTLNVLELDNEKSTATLASALELGDNYASIIIQDTTIYLSYNNYYDPWYYYDDMGYVLEGDDGVKVKTSGEESSEPDIKTRIQIIDASTPSNLVLKTTLGLKNYGSISKIEGNKLYFHLNDANGILIYDTTDLEAPDFIGYFPIQGWASNIREDASTGKIYFACGWYGVLMVDVSE